jgi:hypothetical protein
MQTARQPAKINKLEKNSSQPLVDELIINGGGYALNRCLHPIAISHCRPKCHRPRAMPARVLSRTTLPADCARPRTDQPRPSQRHRLPHGRDAGSLAVRVLNPRHAVVIVRLTPTTRANPPQVKREPAPLPLALSGGLPGPHPAGPSTRSGRP